MSEWRFIDGNDPATKDGRTLMLRHPVRALWVAFPGFWRDDHWESIDEYQTVYPTHWMPLPEPPGGLWTPLLDPPSEDKPAL